MKVIVEGSKDVNIVYSACENANAEDVRKALLVRADGCVIHLCGCGPGPGGSGGGCNG